ncbi:unnamed protein product [Phytophthora fragariaefolia]|uniref:Unnamed protein product n=1 Tax=Phytophthora fragariaefolia TaxID=1490495 RepID=A0A9W6Y7C1_9STRA|nr:unnamed protein product [Phytophthora fragariaefolia]
MMGGTSHGGLAPESLRTLESRESSDRLLVVHGRVRGYEYPFRIVIDSGASKNFARRQSGARNADKFADAPRENSGAGPVSVRLANGSLVEVPRILMDLSVKFEDFDSTERFIVLEMDKYDLILGMPWLEKHEPWIDWRGKAIGASRPALFDRALVSHVPTSVKSMGVRQGRQGASAPEEFMGVAEVFGVPQEVTVDSVKESAEALPGVKPSEPREASRPGWASCPACGVAKSVDPDTGSRRAIRASTDKVVRAAHQVGNLVPPEQEISQREPSVVPHEPVKAKQEGKVGGDASCVGNIVPHKASMAADARDEASSDVGNIVPRRCRRRRRRHRKWGMRSQTGVAHGDSEPKAKAPQTRSSDGHYHVFDSETGLRVKTDAVQLEALPEVAELLNLEEMSLDDFLADFKAGEIAEMVLLRPDPTPEELNSPSVMDEDVLEEFRKQRASRLGSEILKNPKDAVYPLMKEFEDVVSKTHRLNSRRIEVLGTRSISCQAQSTVSRAEQRHGVGQTPIPRKDVLLNNMTGCSLYSALDLVDGYYQILMRESDIPLTPVSTPSGMLWAWLVMPQGLLNAPATFNRLVTQLFRPLRAFAQTYFDDIFVHSRAENGQTAMEVHLGTSVKCLRSCELTSSMSTSTNASLALRRSKSQKDLRKWLGLANYLHKYSAGYAGLAKHLSDLLKKDTDWRFERQHQESFDSIKASLQRAPIMALPDESKLLSVVCDASDYAIGCALLQTDEDGHERVQHPSHCPPAVIQIGTSDSGSCARRAPRAGAWRCKITATISTLLYARLHHFPANVHFFPSKMKIVQFSLCMTSPLRYSFSDVQISPSYRSVQVAMFSNLLEARSNSGQQAGADALIVQYAAVTANPGKSCRTRRSSSSLITPQPTAASRV